MDRKAVLKTGIGTSLMVAIAVVLSPRVEADDIAQKWVNRYNRPRAAVGSQN